MAGCVIYCCFCEYIILYRFVVYMLKINLLVGCSVLTVILTVIILFSPPLFFFTLERLLFCVGLLATNASQPLVSLRSFSLSFLLYDITPHSPAWSPSFFWYFSVSFTFRTIFEIKSSLILENDILLWDLRFTH